MYNYYSKYISDLEQFVLESKPLCFIYPDYRGLRFAFLFQFVIPFLICMTEKISCYRYGLWNLNKLHVLWKQQKKQVLDKDATWTMEQEIEWRKDWRGRYKHLDHFERLSILNAVPVKICL